MTTRTGRLFRQEEDCNEFSVAVVKGPVFTLFPKLPPEVRRLIWYEAVEDDRIVEIGSYDSKAHGRHEVRFTSRTIVPPMIHACPESRAVVVGAKIYEKLVFGGRFTGTYVNWTKDIIIFNRTLSYRIAVENMHLDCNASDLSQKCCNLGVQDVHDLLSGQYSKWKQMLNVERVISIQRSFSCTGLEVYGNGILRLVQISQDEISSYTPWRRSNYEASLRRLEELKKKQPKIKLTSLMTARRGREKRYSPTEQAARRRQARIIEAPRPWKISFKNYRVIDLQQAALERGLSRDGLKKDLIERLEAHEDTRFAQALENYNKENPHET